MESIEEQGDTSNEIKPKAKHIMSAKSSQFISQSEEDDFLGNSECLQSNSDKTSQPKTGKRTKKATRKDLPEEDDDLSSNSDSKSKGEDSQQKRKKKLEQYKNQVIVDQYGTFEYDKDPEGYKKARKRQQNRESALRARDKRVNKMESVEQNLTQIKSRSTNLEKENLILKAEKKQLQDQVQNLLSIITSFGGMKRFKTREESPEPINNSQKVHSVENRSTDK